MFNRHCFGALLLTGLVLSLNGCNTNSSSGLTKIVISPSTVTVELAPPGYQQGQSQYTAIGYYGHAGHQSTQDITDQVTWSSSGVQVATVSSTGLATATGFDPKTGLGWLGTTNITASAPGYNGDIVSNTSTFNVTSCGLCGVSDISAITVSPATQSVATLGVDVQFVAIGKTVGGDTVPLTNGGGVKWTSSVPSIASINDPASGVATTIGAGTATITATYTNADGSGASGTATLTVAPSGSPEPLTAMAVSPNAQTSLAVGDTAKFLAIATTNAGPTVNLTNQTATVNGHLIKAATWTSSNPSVATIDPNLGVAQALSAGVSVITALAYNPDGTVVTGASTYTVTVSSTGSTEPLTALTILPASQTSLTTGTGADVNFMAIGTLGSGGTVLLTNTAQTINGQTINPVSWYSSNPSVASFADKTIGIATPNSAGATAITAVVTNPDKTQVIGTVPYTVTVSATKEPLVSLAVSPATQAVQVGNTSANFIAIATTGQGATVNLTDPKTYTVPGTSPAQIIKWALWTSSNPAVATIDTNTGIITAKAAGVTAITGIATNPDGTVVSNSASLTVTAGASEPLVSLAILPTTQTSLASGAAADVNFIAIGTTSSGATVDLTTKAYTIPGTSPAVVIPIAQWSSSNKSVASFASPTGGVATPNGNGTTAITAIVTNPDGSVVTGSAAYTVTVPATTEPLVSLAVLPSNQTSLATGAAANVHFIAIGTTSSGATVDMTTKTYTDPVSLKVIPVAQWTSSNPLVASFASTTGGVATPNTAGATAITAVVTNPDGTVVTGSAAYTVTVPTVTEAYVSLTIVPASQTLTSVGQQAQFLAIGTTGSGTTVNLTSLATWSSSDANSKVVKQVGTTNVFTAVANGAVAITAIVPNPPVTGATKADGTSVTASGSLSVDIGTPEPLLSLSILPNSQSVAGVGQLPTQFLAIGDFADSSSTPGSQNMANISTYTVNWFSSDPSVATIAKTTGLVTAVGEGATAITAIATNNADKSGATASASFTVSGAAVEPISALALFPGSPSVTLPIIGSVNPATVSFIAIGTNGSTGLQTNVNSLVQWTSTNPLVATVDNTGKATAISEGTTTITITYTNPASAGSGVVTASTVLTVSAAASEPLTAVTIYPPNPSVSTPNESSQLLAIGTFAAEPTTQDITAGLASPAITTSWSSSNTGVATVTTACPTGITAKSCTIADCPSGSTGATCTTCVAPAVAVGSSCVTKNLATPVGTVYSISKGSTAIMAIAKNPDGTLVPATTSFSVLGGSTEAITALTIYPGSQAATAPAQNSQFLVLGTSGDTGLTYDVTSLVQWCSSNATVATIESTLPGSSTCSNMVGASPGLATAKSSGNTTFSAIYTNPNGGGQVIATATYNVTIGAAPEPLLSISVIPGDITVWTKGQSAQFLAFGTYSTAPTVRDITDQVTWYSSLPELATIESSGTSGETGGVATAMGYTGTSDIYAFDSNPDGTVATSNAVTFTCEDPNTHVCDPGPAPVLLATLTVYNSGSIYDTGENQSTWLVTAPDDQGKPNLIHCGPGSEIAGLGDSVCTGSYAVVSDVKLTAYLTDPAKPGQTIAVDNTFGGWSSNCDTTATTTKTTFNITSVAFEATTATIAVSNMAPNSMAVGDVGVFANLTGNGVALNGQYFTVTDVNAANGIFQIEYAGTPGGPYATGGTFTTSVNTPNPDLTSSCTLPVDTNTSVGAIFYSLSLGCSAVTTGKVGTAFNSPAITISNGTTPYVFSTLGTLPAGLALNVSTGAVTGTPTASGSFSVTATDANGTTASSASACAITITQ